MELWGKFQYKIDSIPSNHSCCCYADARCVCILCCGTFCEIHTTIAKNDVFLWSTDMIMNKKVYVIQPLAN